MWTLDWNLVVVITMCQCSGGQEGNGSDSGKHDCGRMKASKAIDERKEGRQDEPNVFMQQLSCLCPECLDAAISLASS